MMMIRRVVTIILTGCAMRGVRGTGWRGARGAGCAKPFTGTLVIGRDGTKAMLPAASNAIKQRQRF